MTKQILWIGGLVIAVWLIHDYIEENRTEKQAAIKEQRETAKIKSDIATLEMTFGAKSKWVETLRNGEKYRSKPIFSIELEKEWLVGKPILFLGSILDIATHDERSYQVELDQGMEGVIFDTELGLTLKADKQLIDKFLRDNPTLLENFGWNNSVAVAAKVSGIQSHRTSDTEGNIILQQKGQGELLGIVFIGRARL